MESRAAQIESQEIEFPTGKIAQVVCVDQAAQAAEVLGAFELQTPQVIFLISGGAGSMAEETKSHLAQLFNRGIAYVAAHSGALIIDGGTQSGVMDLMGRGAASYEQNFPLLGVAPSGKVTYPGRAPVEGKKPRTPLEPHHTHFVLVDGDRWGDETALMFKLAAVLSSGTVEIRELQHLESQNGKLASQKRSIPVITFLAGGGVQGIARNEVLQSVRHGWPILLIQGSGGLADTIAAALAERPDFIDDPDLAEIIESGEFLLYPIDETVAGFRRLILRQMEPDQMLVQAWKLYRRYSQRAKAYQRTYYRLQILILSLGVLTTALVLLQTSFKDPSLSQGLLRAVPGAIPTLQVIIIALPILISILLALAGRLNAGNRWILLRNSAEAIKRAIFIYRTRPPVYHLSRAKGSNRSHSAISGSQQEDLDSQAGELAHKIETISRQLMQTEVNHAALFAVEENNSFQHHSTDGDDGLSFLTPRQYIALRLEDQLTFYILRTMSYEKELNRTQAAILVAGGVGTFLAAVGLELWVALTTSLTAALAAYLQHRQTENLLVRYNQAATDLQNIKNWWIALPPNEQARPEIIRQLVEYTEKVLENEQTGWMQEMRDALSGLRDKQAEIEAEEILGLKMGKKSRS